MSDLSRFDGKVAVITGAAQGIGEATARLLAERGIAGLLLTDRQAARLDAVAGVVAGEEIDEPGNAEGGQRRLDGGVAVHGGDSEPQAAQPEPR